MNDEHDNRQTDDEMLNRLTRDASVEAPTAPGPDDGYPTAFGGDHEPVVTDSPTEAQASLIQTVLENRQPTVVHVVYCDEASPKVMEHARYWHNAVPRMRDVAEEIQALLDKTDKKPVDWSAAEFRAELVKVRDAINLEFG
jgi:hypothetical protein